MESNLPATGSETAVVEAGGGTAPDRSARPPVRRPISVAFLPLALATFVVIAFAMAAWTFLAAGG
jgi:hypothetical protein